LQQIYSNYPYFFSMAEQPLGGLGLLIFRGFTISLRHTTFSRTPLDEWPARRRDLYLTTHITHKRHTSMLPVGFEPTIPASERPYTLFVFLFPMARQPLGGLGLLIFSRLRDHTLDTPHSVGLLWTSDQSVAETSTWQHTTLTRERHPCPRRDSKPQSQLASDRTHYPYIPHLITVLFKFTDVSKKHWRIGDQEFSGTGRPMYIYGPRGIWENFSLFLAHMCLILLVHFWRKTVRQTYRVSRKDRCKVAPFKPNLLLQKRPGTLPPLVMVTKLQLCKQNHFKRGHFRD
jgi:hypothetical protein